MQRKVHHFGRLAYFARFMPRIKKRFLLLVFLLPAAAAFSQDDYAVINQHDTLRGKLRYIYKAPPKLVTHDTAVFCHPALVKAYYDSKRKALFRSLVLPEAGEPVFLQVLESGKISLYEWEYVYDNSGTTTTSITWYADKAGMSLQEVKRTGLGGNGINRRQAMEALLADNGPLAQQFQQKELYSFGYLRELIRQYNGQAAQ